MFITFHTQHMHSLQSEVLANSEYLTRFTSRQLRFDSKSATHFYTSLYISIFQAEITGLYRARTCFIICFDNSAANSSSPREGKWTTAAVVALWVETACLGFYVKYWLLDPRYDLRELYLLCTLSCYYLRTFMKKFGFTLLWRHCVYICIYI